MMNPAVGGILTLGTYDKCLELSGTSGNYFLMRWNDSNGKKCRLSPKGLGGGGWRCQGRSDISGCWLVKDATFSQVSPLVLETKPSSCFHEDYMTQGLGRVSPASMYFRRGDEAQELPGNAWSHKRRVFCRQNLHLVLFDRRFLCCSLWRWTSVFSCRPARV